MEKPDGDSQTLLQVLERLAARAEPEGYRLGEIIDHMNEKAFGAMLFVLALPCCIPFLYGVPQAVALPMAALAGQMALGREEPWLPERFARRRIDRKGLSGTAKGGRKWFGWVERLAHPRILIFSSKRAERWIGMVLSLFSLSILLPVPGTNTVPGFAVALVAFGLMARDGILILVGLILGTVWISLLMGAVILALQSVLG